MINCNNRVNFNSLIFNFFNYIYLTSIRLNFISFNSITLIFFNNYFRFNTIKLNFSIILNLIRFNNNRLNLNRLNYRLYLNRLISRLFLKSLNRFFFDRLCIFIRYSCFLITNYRDSFLSFRLYYYRLNRCRFYSYRFILLIVYRCL